MTKTIDLNADVGEGERSDAALLGIVSSCNIACGGHAGDARSIRATLALALRNGVAAGAHPAYPDRQGFGRRSGFVAGDELAQALAVQLDAFQAVAAKLDATAAHVKPHGALYNDAAGDPALAGIVAAAAATLSGPPALVGPPGSELAHAAKDNGLRFIAEGFVDRAYCPDGRLVPRSDAAAVHTHPEVVCAQATELALRNRVRTTDGSWLELHVATLCVHGDTPGSEQLAAAVLAALKRQGVRIHA